jgi:hypothetical protein
VGERVRFVPFRFGRSHALCRGLEIVLADGPGVRQACEAPLFAPPPGPAAWAPFSIEVVGMAREGKAGDVLRGQSQFGSMAAGTLLRTILRLPDRGRFGMTREKAVDLVMIAQQGSLPNGWVLVVDPGPAPEFRVGKNSPANPTRQIGLR